MRGKDISSTPYLDNLTEMVLVRGHNISLTPL